MRIVLFEPLIVTITGCLLCIIRWVSSSLDFSCDPNLFFRIFLDFSCLLISDGAHCFLLYGFWSLPSQVDGGYACAMVGLVPFVSVQFILPWILYPSELLCSSPPVWIFGPVVSFCIFLRISRISITLGERAHNMFPLISSESFFFGLDRFSLHSSSCSLADECVCWPKGTP